MKKTLLLTALLVTSYHLFAFTTQGVWRWRKDDGSETSATWRAAQSTPITIASADSTLRLRIELYNNGSGGTLDNALFEDSSNEAGGHWDTIKTTVGVNAFKLAGTSPFVTDLEATTHQLSGQSTGYTFDTGRMIVATDRLPAHTVAAAQTTEYEYVFKPTANIKPNVTYYFRVDAATYLVGYVFPSLTTAGVLPVNITSFSVSPGKNNVLIKWTTATEHNNSYFEIQRSADGKNYSRMATLQGNGTSSISHYYEAYDTKPLNGINYYRIKQVDADGKYQISDVRFIKMAMQNYVLKVFPNPSRGDVAFALNNYNGNKVTATLSNASGKTVHQELIQMNSSNNYKLNLHNKLSQGIYFLQLKGDALSENIKVVIQ